jgi:hypothetical protein
MPSFQSDPGRTCRGKDLKPPAEIPFYWQQ